MNSFINKALPKGSYCERGLVQQNWNQIDEDIWEKKEG
jgi:hypothetical protein